MRHATLYRRWRPRTFSQIVGQEPVVRTLRRAIETNRVSHAYLFSGPRGTGKTSTAKVLAMGLNCAKGPTPEPDGTCNSCRAIVNNSSMDVVEMDAASNRGIDEIRDLRDRVNLAPVSGRVKVYIIDEVHMLTAEAFNALLKMLEEPPEHVIFVLATTEKHKVLPTIISRCQSFDFRRPGVPVIAEKLKEISEAENIEAEPEALTVIAGAGGGSFRDAEGLLDQLSSFSEGKITTAMVRELLGSVGSETLIETTAALHERRAADALRIVDRLSNEGRDPGQFVTELLSHLRNLMLLPHAPEVALAGVGVEERGPLREQAEAIPTAGVVRMIEALGDALGRMKRGGDPKLELELTFLKLTRDYTEPPIENLMSRLEALEQAVANGVAPVSAGKAPLKPPEAVPEKAEDPDEEATEAGGDGTGGVGEIEEDGPEEASLDWRAVVAGLRKRGRRGETLATIYENANVRGFDDGVLGLALGTDMEYMLGTARKPEALDLLQEVIEEQTGTKPRVEIEIEDGTRKDFAPPEVSTKKKEPATPDTPAPEPSVEPQRERKSDFEAVDDPGASGSAEADDRIRDEQEAFDFVRETLGHMNRDGGIR